MHKLHDNHNNKNTSRTEYLNDLSVCATVTTIIKSLLASYMSCCVIFFSSFGLFAGFFRIFYYSISYEVVLLFGLATGMYSMRTVQS